MKLVYPIVDLHLLFQENMVQVVSVEEPHLFTAMVSDLWRQASGESGEFILSDGDKLKNISKELEVIINPFAMNCNEKKVLNKLYQEIVDVMETDVEKISIINSEIVALLSKMETKLPYPLNYNLEMDIISLIKLYNIRIEDTSIEFVDRMIDYLRIYHQICRVEHFVFVNLKQYLTADELKGLYEFACYEKLNLILLEGRYQSKSTGEKNWIIDKDRCIIEID